MDCKKTVSIFLCIICISFDVNALSYETFSKDSSTSVHILIIDPKEHTIIPVKASGNDIARETVVALANRYEAIAAINGGFWKIDGTPAGILKINHCWYGTPVKPRGAIGWSPTKKSVSIDRILTNYQLNDCSNAEKIKVIPASDPPKTTPEDWENLEHIVGGTPVLISKGAVIEDFSPEQTMESFIINKHSRTSVGIRNNGEWVFVVVDRCPCTFHGGMTIKELAELMFELGCIEALNLDGGGASTMVVEGHIMNKPCGKFMELGQQSESVSDAILIFSDKK